MKPVCAVCGSSRKVRKVILKKAESVGGHKFFRKSVMTRTVWEYRCSKHWKTIVKEAKLNERNREGTEVVGD